jgi:aromatic ring-opening dioxygenase catalytic subunit (LigB family)
MPVRESPGFPPESYEFKYDAPGSPELASKVQRLLAAEAEQGIGGTATAAGTAQPGIPCDLEPSRGYDHGMFVPLMLAYPEAQVPVVVLSLHPSLNPELHLEIGRKLAPLRDEGVLILGSGFAFHNMRFDGGGGKSGSPDVLFDEALRSAVTSDDVAKRDQALAQWSSMPHARYAHPREEHLLPLMVVAGAAGLDTGRVSNTGTVMGKCQVSNFIFEQNPGAEEKTEL